MNAMIRDEKGVAKKSNLDILIGEIDELFINAGLGGKTRMLEPDPNRHRIIVRMPKQKKA